MQGQATQKIWTAGSGGSGQLLQDFDDKLQFKEIAVSDIFPTILKKVYVQGMYGAALGKDEQAYFWGQILGEPTCIPKQIGLQATKIACGWDHMIFLSMGGVFGVGSNLNGQLGIEDQINFLQPVKIPIEHSIKVVSAGMKQSALVSFGNEVYISGMFKHQFKGMNTQATFNQFFKWMTNIKKIKFGNKYVFLFDLEKNIQVYGSLQVGIQNDQNFVHTGQVLTDKVRTFDCGWFHAIVLRDEKPFLMGFGRNNMGQLGKVNEFNILEVEDAQNVSKVKCGSDSSYLIYEDKVLATGWNEHGNLAKSTTANSYSFDKLNFNWSLPDHQLAVGGASSLLLQKHQQKTSLQKMI